MGKYCEKLKRGLRDPKRIYGAFLSSKACRALPSRFYLKRKYRALMGKPLNLKNPRTYNEKLQWLKLYGNKPEYSALVDKYAVREYVAKKIGEERLIPLLGVWNCFDEIDFSTLPDQFVLKPTHTSGDVFICRDKSAIDFGALKQKVDGWMRREYYWLFRELPYKGIKPRILAEKLMVDESGTELKDYKFFCFDGEPKALFIATDRPFDTRFDFFDMDFRHLPFTNGHPNADRALQKPVGFNEMQRIAAELSKGFVHIRVDLYDINGKIYFGELTFFHFSGIVPFVPEEWDRIFGDWIRLPV